MQLDEIAEQILACRRCPLHQHRTRPVPGEGPANAKLMLVGEAPGRFEDKSGKPFVGAAGKFLDELLSIAGLKRSDVFIGNVVKCRPPNNRDPLESEIKACSPWLDMQFNVIRPRLVVSLGRFSMDFFLEKFALPKKNISEIHGQVFKVDTLMWHGYFVPMYHPAAALYRGNVKEEQINDWKILADFIKQRL
ncbi:uracil-DNA glycosylase [Candidatus Micrarchaeota archaeon]|nr:MAG: uracil-DNA glycosylase [Candidatus Micrarchaeota archaeon]